MKIHHITLFLILSCFYYPLNFERNDENNCQEIYLLHKLSVVPKPKTLNLSQEILYLEKNELIFKINPRENEMISYNIELFLQNAFSQPEDPVTDCPNKIRIIRIVYDDCIEAPNFFMDEKYEINVSESEIVIKAKTCIGVVRALSTLMQLVNYDRRRRWHFIPKMNMEDEPRFSFRGFLIDTSRHFLPVKLIKRSLEIMAIAKLNVLHWHIVDDESFPYVSENFPNISLIGTVDGSKRYSQQDVSSIIKHARKLGIFVLPEFDTPGHTASWKAIPNFNTDCDLPGSKPVDPTYEPNYQFLSNFFDEIQRVFNFKYLHIGGDEVDMKCWESMDRIVRWMKMHNMKNGQDLQTYYIKKLLNITLKLWENVIVWQEVFFSTNERFDKRLIVNIWTSNENNELTRRVVQNGYKVIFGSCWYLNIVNTYENWVSWYDCDPTYNIDWSSEHLVIGGTISMWGEKVFPANFLPRSWMRSFVPAERLWSTRDTRNYHVFSQRIFILFCRLQKLGFEVTDIDISRECPP